MCLRRPKGNKKLTSWTESDCDRIIYTIEDHRLIVVVVKVGDRKDIYDR